MKHNILLVDDDPAILKSMSDFLSDEGFFVKAVQNGAEGVALVRQNTIPFSLALIDYHMPQMNGVEVIKEIRKYNKDLTIFGFSGDESDRIYTESLESGAFHLISKETTDAKLLGVLHRACKEVERKTKPLVITDESANSKLIKEVGMIGVSNSMADVAKNILKYASKIETVLIRGENGTGKEMVARAIHQHSPRRLQKFVDINCGAIPEDLIESELFGHMKGAFTGAVRDKVGKFLAANGGTIFLDEIGEMPPHMQVKLLRVIQQREITPIGSNVSKPIDVRIIAATNAPLEELIEQKRFREDLFYRINVLPITLPPLRDRTEDISFLVSHFLDAANKRAGTQKLILETSIDDLKKLKWPGNVRELQNAISFLVNTSEDPYLDLSLLPKESLEKKPPVRKIKDYDSLKFKSFKEEKVLIEEALLAASNPTAAARMLGMKRSTLRDKISKYGINISKESKEQNNNQINTQIKEENSI